MSERSPLVAVDRVSKAFDGGLVQALADVTFALPAGEIWAVTGPSGSGKSTLLNLIGTLDEPSSGEIRYEGRLLRQIGDLPAFRRSFVGLVLQFHHLIPVLTLRENVEAALLPNPAYTPRERRERAAELLASFGLQGRLNAYARQVSAGERQRAAVARALANDPVLVVADEPTGNVDSENGEQILRHLERYVRDAGRTLLIATHDPRVAAIADEVLRMRDGRRVDSDG